MHLSMQSLVTTTIQFEWGGVDSRQIPTHWDYCPYTISKIPQQHEALLRGSQQAMLSMFLTYKIFLIQMGSSALVKIRLY